MAVKKEKTTDEILKETLENPASVSVDGQSVSQHNLKDVIEADRYLASKAASRSGKPGIRLFKFKRGGFND